MTISLTTASAGSSMISSLLSTMRANFVQRADTDDNNAISLDEFLSAGQKVPGGKNDQAEGTDKAKALFAKIDTDGDNSLSTSELDSYEQKLVAELQAALTQLQELLGQTDGDQPPPPPPPHSRPSLSEDFETIDADANGSVTKDELAAHFVAKGMDETKAAARAEKLIEKADTSGDGELNSDEATAFDEARRASFEEHRNSAGASQAIILLIQALQGGTTDGTSASATLSAASAYSG